MSSCVESLGIVCAGFVGTVVDPDDAGGCWCSGLCSESFGVLEVVPLVDEIAIAVGAAPGAVVDFLGREQGDAGVFVVGVVPGHVVVEVGAGVFEGLGNSGVVRAVYHRVKLGLGARVVVWRRRAGCGFW